MAPADFISISFNIKEQLEKYQGYFNDDIIFCLNFYLKLNIGY